MEQRQLKFRVWDGVKFVWGADYAIDCNGQLMYNYDHYEWTTHMESEMIIQQWTGLTDKNGVDIYEGDILEYVIDNETFQSRVIFAVGGYFGFYRGENVSACVIYATAPISSIIGNIFENKDLIK